MLAKKNIHYFIPCELPNPDSWKNNVRSVKLKIESGYHASKSSLWKDLPAGQAGLDGLLIF